MRCWTQGQLIPRNRHLYLHPPRPLTRIFADAVVPCTVYHRAESGRATFKRAVVPGASYAQGTVHPLLGFRGILSAADPCRVSCLTRGSATHVRHWRADYQTGYASRWILHPSADNWSEWTGMAFRTPVSTLCRGFATGSGRS